MSDTGYLIKLWKEILQLTILYKKCERPEHTHH
jgi:hypothetical protein